jgi:DNA-binding NarL/FixJ family response regulator
MLRTSLLPGYIKNTNINIEEKRVYNKSNYAKTRRGQIQQEVLSYVFQGLNNKEIAVRMNIEVSTVKFHVTRLLRKYKAASRVQLIVKELNRYKRLYG